MKGNSAAIRALIKDYVSEQSPGGPAASKELARRHEVLPIILDGGGALAIDLHGQVVRVAWDDSARVFVEATAQFRNAVFVEASKRYPALASLAPQRPPDAVQCLHCAGTGVLAVHPEAICICGGTGWIG
jgi:hypothetical protein